jgi:hypothetical protein
VNRVRNLWGTTTTTLASGGNNSMTLTAGTYIFSMGAGTGTATFSGTGGATGTLAASAAGRVSVTKTITAGTLVVTASVADLNNLQVEDRTGASNTTDAMPYVSIGVESAPAYHGSFVDGVLAVPRDYSGNPLPTSESATYPMRGHHVEAAAQNLSTYSNEVPPSAGAAVTRALTTGANGRQTAVRLTETTANAQHYQQWPAVTKAASAIQYTVSAVIRGGTRRYVGLFIGDTSGNGALATFDTTTGTISGAAAAAGASPYTGVSATIARYGVSGQWLATVTATSNTATFIAAYVVLSNDGTNSPTYTGAVDKYADAESVQIETGAFASSRINTTTGAITRPADVPSYTGALCGQITSLATSFWRPTGVSTAGAIASLSDGTANEYESIGLTSATAVQFTGVDGGASQWATTASNTYTAGTQAKAAQSATTNSVLMDLNGTAQTPDTVATMPTVTTLQLGHLNGASQLNGAVGPTYGWTRLLSQSELGAVDR